MPLHFLSLNEVGNQVEFVEVKNVGSFYITRIGDGMEWNVMEKRADI